MKIPTYEELEEKDEGQLNPLEIFVINNEPAVEIDAKVFREQLQGLVDWICDDEK